MIDVLKYMRNTDYVKGKCDCWTLLQEIYSNEHGLELPDTPCDSAESFGGYIEELEKPEMGCIIHKSGIIEHVGYCIGGENYIHRTNQGTLIGRVGKNKCRFYKVLKNT